MSTNLRELVCHLSTGDPIAYGKVRIVPLGMKQTSDLEYLTLDDGCSETVVTVEETSTSGSVPELRVRNNSRQRVLIPDGSTLIGAKQNRVVKVRPSMRPWRFDFTNAAAVIEMTGGAAASTDVRAGDQLEFRPASTT